MARDPNLDTAPLLGNDAVDREPLQADGAAASPSTPAVHAGLSTDSPGGASVDECSANGNLTERLLGAEPTFGGAPPLPLLNTGDEERQLGASAEVSPLQERPPSRTASPSPAHGPPRQASLTRTPFSLALASATLHAAEHMAGKLIERLQTACAEQAAIGQYNLVWDETLPSGRRLSDAVARCFANQLKDLGFSRLEWWNGREWSSKYGIVKDTMQDRYNLRLRVHWSGSIQSLEIPDSASWERLLSRQDSGGSAHEFNDASLRPLLQQLQEVMVLQQQVLQQTIAARVAAEHRAARAEERAAAAERQRCEALGSLAAYTTAAERQRAKRDVGCFRGLHHCFCCAWGQRV